MARPVKPALPHARQIAALKEKGMVFPDEKRAETVLSRVSVYRLRAYWIGLVKDNDFCGLSFDDVVRLYEFDSRLRRLMHGAVESVEIALRAQIAQILGVERGPEGYRDPRNFRDSRRHADFLNALDRSMGRAKHHPVIRHHQGEYGGRYPILAAIEFVSFGPLSKLFANMLPDDQKAVCESWPGRPKPVFLESWLHMFTIIRNICAHYGRLYNVPIHATPRMYAEEKQYVRPVKLFGMLLVTRRCLPPSEWAELCGELFRLTDEYGDVVNPRYLGFPGSYREMLR